MGFVDALHGVVIELAHFSFKRCLSMVRTCSKSTMESFCRPGALGMERKVVGRFVLSRWLVMAAAISRGTEPVAHIVLHNKHGAHAALLAAHHGA